MYDYGDYDSELDDDEDEGEDGDEDDDDEYEYYYDEEDYDDEDYGYEMMDGINMQDQYHVDHHANMNDSADFEPSHLTPIVHQ